MRQVAGFSPLAGNDRAFRFSPPNLTLGGDESWASAINSIGDVVSTSSLPSIDAHAFLFTESTGMVDLQTLGGYSSTAFALNNTGSIVGPAEILNRDLHAFVCTVRASSSAGAGAQLGERGPRSAITPSSAALPRAGLDWASRSTLVFRYHSTA